MERYFDVAIVGAGPSGLTAAITVKLAKPKAKVIVLEKKNVPAKKLSASGNGRGNLSNKRCEDLEQVLSFFSESGIAVRTDEEGRIYPYSEEAASVSEALVRRAAGLGVELFINSQVKGVEADSKSGFRIFVCDNETLSNYKIEAEKILIATGGKSFAVYGSSGDGYNFAKKLGHSVTPLVPALTGIEIEEDISKLKGVRVKASVSFFEKEKLVFREEGEVQFREDSLSGICIMNMSSRMPVGRFGADKNIFDNCIISIDFVPDYEYRELLEFLTVKGRMAQITAVDFLTTLVKKPLAAELLKRAGIESECSVCGLNEAWIKRLAKELKDFRLKPCGRKGWKEAQVTKGGVSLSEICSCTMESLIVHGLYFAGEVLDYDGPCGGYNLNNAWVTGIKAGRAMAEEGNNDV
ncbi:MAG: aminoacetone oxidase family FAD-binding enzyme [Firmicutes bacterium]|nr:aminoacetone oxidase family FAD-binding enzyme [Bacillota bacterium]